MYFIGYDVGSSSIKASVLDGSTGLLVATASYPETEMEISVIHPDWAEQDPDTWWKNIVKVTNLLFKHHVIDPAMIKAIGIAYQMHGLVLVDKNKKVYRLDGPLFFGSVTSFYEQFNVKDDPSEVIIDFRNARVMDSSGAEAIDVLTDKYKKVGKKLTLRHLSEDCKKVLKVAGPFCTYEEDDPTYKVAVNI